MTQANVVPVSVVIRAKNEARWLWKCLEAISSQEAKPSEIIVVDNESTDQTIEIAKAAGVDKIVTIQDYTPGKALNLGFQVASNELVAIISGHCVPASDNWLKNLVRAATQQPEIAAAYGRQLPLPFSDDRDKADLYAVFRNESRIQTTDGFMNNANSIIKRKIWESNPFDESITNIEDRVWGSQVIGQGFKIAYDANATVFHHNGMHRSGQRSDQSPTVKVIESRVELLSKELPLSYRHLYDQKIVPLLVSNSTTIPELRHEIESISKAVTGNFWLPMLVVSDLDIASTETVLSRAQLALGAKASIGDLLSAVSRKASEIWPLSRYLAMFIGEMGFPSAANVRSLVRALVEEDSDSVFFGERDYGHIWFRDEAGTINQLDSSLSLRGDRRETFRVIYGKGSIFSLDLCMDGNPFMGKKSIVEVGEK